MWVDRIWTWAVDVSRCVVDEWVVGRERMACVDKNRVMWVGWKPKWTVRSVSWVAS